MHKRYEDDMLLIGQTAPSFQTKAINGTIHYPEDYKGKWVVVFSIPRDFQPELIAESKLFAEILNEFGKIDTQLIGLCMDSIYHYIHFSNHFKEMEQGDIQNVFKFFSVVEDAEKNVAKKLCMIHTRFQFMVPVEPVFIIDPSCRIRCIQNYTDSTWKKLIEINRIVAALQNADAVNKEMLK
ncbi:MAG: redoxin domain-containing protein [Eubacteriales bacterium]|nr:redoxin domain-containing protein [Eubacteriales bacterium]